MVTGELLNALYMIYQGHKINRIDFNAWYDCLVKCQNAIISDNKETLEKVLTDTLMQLKK